MANLDRVVKAVRLLLALTVVPPMAACASQSEVIGTIGNTDGAPSESPGSPSGPPRFAPPTLIDALVDPAATDEDPTFTADFSELYFMSTRGGTRDIWLSRRVGSGTDAAWGSPSPVVELNSTASDWAAAVSLDGLTIWFATDRDGANGHIWRAMRPSRSASWGPPQPVTELASSAVDFAPALDATGTILYFSSDRPGSGGFDIYASSRATSGALWTTPTRVLGINTDQDELDPFVAQGGLVVFFTSRRSGNADIFWTMRASTTAPFPTPTPLTEINSSSYDSDSTLSPDLTYLMFSSTRSGSAELYESHSVR